MPSGMSEDLRDSVADYRDASSDEEVRGIRDWWGLHGITNHVQALRRAAELERADES